MKRFFLLFALLFLIGNAIALAPIINFSWLPASPLVGGDVNFFGVATNESFNPLFLNWGFSDGNVSFDGYYKDQNIVYQNNFNDGTFAGTTPALSTPGNYWSIVGGWLDTNKLNANIYYNFTTGLPLQDRNWDISWKQQVKTAANHSASTYFMTRLSDATGFNGISFDGSTMRIKLVANGVGDLIDANDFLYDTNYSIKVTYRDGNWSVYVNGGYSGSAVSNVNVDWNYFYLTNQGANDANALWDDFNIVSYIGNEIDKNFSRTLLSSNVCLTATNLFGSTTQCKMVPIVGKIKMNFFDENTLLPIYPTVKVNGVSQSLVGNTLAYSLAGVSSLTDFTVTASDSNRTERSWFFNDLNQDSLVDLNAFLLDTNKGRSIDFRFYAPDKVTKFPNAIISVRRANDQNYVGITRINSDSDATFFLNPDANYTFDVDVTGDGTSDYNYSPIQVSVLVPKNENTLDSIIPFRTTVSNLANIDNNNLTNTFTFYAFHNTKSPYRLTIDSNTLSYFERYYTLRFRGNDTSYTLQPYLLRAVDGGFQGVFTLTDSFTGQKIQGYTLEFRADVGGTANVLVESGYSDSAGQILFTTITGKQYNLTLLDTVGDIFKTGPFISSTSSTYYLDTFTGKINAGLPTKTGSVDINIVWPTDKKFYLNDANNYGLRVRLLTNGPTVTDVNIVITNRGTVLANNGFSNALGYPNGQTFDTNFTGINQAYAINVSVIMQTSYGTITKNFVFTGFNKHRVSGSFPGFGNLVGELGLIGSFLLWLAIGVFATIAIRFSPFSGIDNGAMVWLWIVWGLVGAFTGLLPWMAVGVAAIGGIGLWFLNRQPFGYR